MVKEDKHLTLILYITGLSKHNFMRLVRSNVLPELPDGKEYSVPVYVRAYISHLKQNAKSGNTTLDGERTRLTKNLADAEEIRIGTMRAEFIDGKVAVELWGRAVGVAKARLTAIPKKLSPIIIMCDSERKVEAAIKIEIDEVLTELSGIKKSDYAKGFKIQGQPQKDTRKESDRPMTAKRLAGGKRVIR
jgi:hypothetical protein